MIRPMSGITRYILRQLAVGMIFISAGLACVMWLTQSLRFVEMIVNKGLSLGTFLKLTGLLMPGFLVVLIPISLFAVVLFTYNRLIADRELVVMRAAGLSHWALARPALILASAATVVGFFLSLWIIPHTMVAFHEMQWNIRNDITSVLLQEGMFNKFGDGLTIYVRARSPDGELLGLLVYDRRSPERPVTLMAERGALVYADKGPRVLMVNGNRQQLAQDSGKLSLLYFDSYSVDFATSAATQDRLRDARERPLSELITADEAKLGASEYRKAKVELHQRITSPLYNFGFAVIALACLLPATFDRRGQSTQIMLAVILMIGLEAVALGTSNLATANLAFTSSMYAAALLPIAGGLWVLADRAPLADDTLFGNPWEAPRAAGPDWGDESAPPPPPSRRQTGATPMTNAAPAAGPSLPTPTPGQTLFGQKWDTEGAPAASAWGDDATPAALPSRRQPNAATAAPVATPTAGQTLFGQPWEAAGSPAPAWGDESPAPPPNRRMAATQPMAAVATQAPEIMPPASTGAKPPAAAQNPAAQSPTTKPTRRKKSEKSDKDEAQPIQMTADQVIHDRDLGIVTAKGAVVVVQGKQTLTADVINYNLKQDIISASGHVSLVEPSGETSFADYFELTGDFKSGVAEEIRLILADHSRLAAASATRVGGTRTDFDHAVYTACEPCRDHPEKTPLWQAKAERATHNQDQQEIEYRDAWLEFMGVPVAYTPYLAHPDPTVRRKSGVLVPTFGNNSSLGPSLSTPYYWVMGEGEDITFAPRWLFGQFGSTTTSGDNVGSSALQRVVLAGEHRWTGFRGETKTTASLTADKTTGDPRGNVNAEGRFVLDNTWRAGYVVQRQSDDTYASIYNFPIVSDKPWLTSRPYLEAFGMRDYAVIEGFDFQGITADSTSSTQTPLVLPHVAYNHQSSPGRYGGTWSVDTDMLAYNRVAGTSAERMSSQVAWQVPYTSRLGEVYTVTTSLRGDGFHAERLADGGGASNTGRAIPQIAVNYRYPFVNESNSFPQVITPLAMVAASPNPNNSGRIPNEDSADFELDDVNVLRPNRLTGIDRVEGGVRGAYGMRWNAYPYHGGQVMAQLAQGWRANSDSTFSEASGFSDHLSDYVGRVQFNPASNLSLYNRMRLDRRTLATQRQETGFSVGPQALRTGLSYGYFEKSSTDSPTAFPRRQFINTTVSSRISEYWSVTGGMAYDLISGGDPLSWNTRVMYNDECFTLAGNFVRNTTSDRDYLAGYTLTLNVIFKTLGSLPFKAF
jgi:LPS-assembly protein